MHGWMATAQRTPIQPRRPSPFLHRNNQATLTFWLHIDTAETTTTTAFDTLTVQVLNTGGTVLATLGTFSNLNHATGYQQHSFSVIPFKGQTVKIRFTGNEDTSLQTSFVIDDVALNVQ